MLPERRDEARRLALKLARLPLPERKHSRFVWTREGKVSRVPSPYSRASDLLEAESGLAPREDGRRLQLQGDPVK